MARLALNPSGPEQLEQLGQVALTVLHFLAQSDPA
jgi:hypothetical protein